MIIRLLGGVFCAFFASVLYLVVYAIASPGEALLRGKCDVAIMISVSLGAMVGHTVGFKIDHLLAGVDSVKVQATTAKQFQIVALVVLMVVLTLGETGEVRMATLTTLACYFGFALIINRVVPTVLWSWLYGKHRRDIAVVLGSGKIVDELEGWVQRNAILKTCQIIVVPGFDGANQGEADLVSTLELFAKKWVPLFVVVERFPEDKVERGRLVRLALEQGFTLVFVNSMRQAVNHSIESLTLNGLPVVMLKNEPLENPGLRVLKRLFDVAIAFVAVIAVLPVLMIVVWVLQRINSPGSLFFTQRRVGLHSKPFRILKFRTMYEWNRDFTTQATPCDGRVYPGGAVLRKLSIDEFPQFINVLFGSMSVVGPRPHLSEHEAAFAIGLEDYSIRHMVKPGITGLAQVRGLRGVTNTPEDVRKRLEADTYYIESWSLTLDAVIVLRTLLNLVLPPKSAV